MFNEHMRAEAVFFLNKLEVLDVIRTGMTNLTMLQSILTEEYNIEIGKLFSSTSLESQIINYNQTVQV